MQHLRYRTCTIMMKLFSLIALFLCVLPSYAQDAQSFLFTFENNGKNAMDLFYVDSPLIEHKMGTVEANGDMTHRVMTGQTFAARILNEDFRVMFQIDHIDYEEGAEAGPEFKITFINIMGETGDEGIDIKYEGKVVGTAKVGEPHTEGVFDHSRMTVVSGDQMKLSVRALRAPNDEL